MPGPAGSRGAGYGLDAELARKQATKYDPKLEREAQQWIEMVTGEKFTKPFADQLKNGITLANLINKIQPGSVRRIETSSMPFKQMENISNFLRACRSLGMAEYDCFETVDLFEQKDLGVVVNCIHALGRRAQTIPSFRGPRLGIAEASKNTRTFTKQQIDKTNGTVSRLNMGSAGIMDRTQVSTANDINFGAKSGGLTSNGGVSRLNMGSAGIMDRTQVSTANDINFGAKSGGLASNGAVSRLNNGSAGVMNRAPVSRANDITFGRDAGAKKATSPGARPPPPPPPPLR